MSNSITVLSKWHHTELDESFCVGYIKVDENKNVIVCGSSLDTGGYDEWFLEDFTKILLKFLMMRTTNYGLE